MNVIRILAVAAALLTVCFVAPGCQSCATCPAQTQEPKADCPPCEAQADEPQACQFSAMRVH